MIVGIAIQAHPTDMQRKIISQWIGCARFVWNAKCDEQNYLCWYAQKYLPVDTTVPYDQTYSQYKNKDLSPWLYDCPSQILRNSVVNWYNTQDNFIKGKCGRPNKKRKSDGGSIHLTKEVFCFEKCSDGVTRLFIGTKSKNIGYLSIKNHKSYGESSSIRIKKKNGKYSVSFCYDDGVNDQGIISQEEHLDYLKSCSSEELDKMTTGIDRGVKIPVQAGDNAYDLKKEQKAKKRKKEKYIKWQQKRLARQKKKSKRRDRTKKKISKAHEKISNINRDFCHKTSRKIVNDENTQVIILEDLKTKQMTKAPKPKKDEETGKWVKNNAAAKAGLNRAILDKGWHRLENYITYKANKKGKVCFKIPANYTSQECADCQHIHPNNRKSQEAFCCERCGHKENADKNAARVIKKRAINLILNPGTGLSKRGVLVDIGRGAVNQTPGADASGARGKETSKNKVKASTA